MDLRTEESVHKGIITVAVGATALILFQIVLLRNPDAANLYRQTGIDPAVAISTIIFLLAAYFLATGLMRSRAGKLKYLRLWWLILQDFRIRSFRNLTMMAGVGVIIGVLFLSLVLTAGAVRSTDVAFGRAGADLIVIPQGTVVQNDLYNYPFAFSNRMDRSVVDRIALVPGIQSVSSQAFLRTVHSGGACGALQSLFLVVVDADDPFVTAWLTDRQPLKKGQVIAGGSVGTSALDSTKDFGWTLSKKASLPLTGTFADHVVYLSTETASELNTNSTAKGLIYIPVNFEKNRFTAVYVKVGGGASVDDVANGISATVSDVTVIKTNELGSNVAKRLGSLLSSFTYIGGLTVGVAVVLVSSLSTVTVNERRREIGTLRSMGASKQFISKLLTSQIVLVTLLGGIAGIVGASLALYFNYAAIISALKIPFIAPSLLDLVWITSLSLIVAVATGAAATLYPAYKTSRMDPYEAIRRESR